MCACVLGHNLQILVYTTCVFVSTTDIFKKTSTCNRLKKISWKLLFLLSFFLSSFFFLFFVLCPFPSFSAPLFFFPSLFHFLFFRLFLCFQLSLLLYTLLLFFFYYLNFLTFSFSFSLTFSYQISFSSPWPLMSKSDNANIRLHLSLDVLSTKNSNRSFRIHYFLPSLLFPWTFTSYTIAYPLSMMREEGEIQKILINRLLDFYRETMITNKLLPFSLKTEKEDTTEQPRTKKKLQWSLKKHG